MVETWRICSYNYGGYAVGVDGNGSGGSARKAIDCDGCVVSMSIMVAVTGRLPEIDR